MLILQIIQPTEFKPFKWKPDNHSDQNTTQVFFSSMDKYSDHPEQGSVVISVKKLHGELENTSR